MNKRFFIILCVILAAFIGLFPALNLRISNEKENKCAVLAVKYDSLTAPLLEKYNKSGVTAAVIEEEENGGFSEEKFKNAVKAGLFPVPALDASGTVKEEYLKEIDSLIKKYDIKYLNVYGECENPDEKNEGLCKVIEDNRLTLILTETKTQLSNERFAGFDECVESANGKVLRGYNSDKRNSLNKIDYDLNYFQMLNSLVDRNIRFFMIRTIEDKEYSDEVNSERTLRATERFSKKLKDLGYKEEPVDFSGYDVNRKVVSAASSLIMAVMGLLMCKWLFGQRKIFDVLALVCGAVLFFAAFVIPKGFLWVYPTLFSVVSPCFCITAVFAFVIKNREKLSSFKLFICSLLVAICSLGISSLVLSALLSGFDYFLNSSVFRGVKISLIAPILFSGVLFLFGKGDSGKIKFKSAREILKQYMKKRYIVTAVISFIAIGAAAILYIKRSGNMMIPFKEAYIRNFITDIIYARPRTKEVIFAWPAFALFLYYAKKFPDGILQWIFATASAMLFASVINTFCHVFTPINIMYLRLVYGIIMAIPFVVVVVLINFAIIKTVQKFKKQ